MNQTSCILFNNNKYVLYTIKSRNDREPICSQCHNSCVEDNKTLKFDCMFYSKFIVYFFLNYYIDKKKKYKQTNVSHLS